MGVYRADSGKAFQAKGTVGTKARGWEEHRVCGKHLTNSLKQLGGL